MGTASELIEPVFKYKQDNGIDPVASIRVRARDQYRLFYDDMSAVSVYVGRKSPECMLLNYAHIFTSAWVGTRTGEARESLFVGTTGGYVMELDRGTSFDGEDITAYLKFAWNSLGSPSSNKRYHSVRIELGTTTVSPSASLSVVCDTQYGNPDLVPSSETLSVAAGGGLWNVSNWNQFYWSAQSVGQAYADFDGFGTNVSPGIISEGADAELSHTLSAMTINYSMRGLKRGA
jgi:hypothetical protein